MDNGRTPGILEKAQDVETWCSRYLKLLGRRGNEVRADCPKCNGNDFWINFSKNGAFRCFNCDWKGGFTMLQSHFQSYAPVDFKASVVPQSTVDLPLLQKAARDLYQVSELDDYTHKYLCSERGICHPERFGLKTTPVDSYDRLKELGWEDNSLIKTGLFKEKYGKIYSHATIAPGRLFIPYYHGSLDNVYGFITRARFGEIITHGPYMIPRGSPSASWIWSDFKENEQSSWCIVTEGQIKAIAVRERGLPCIGLQGVHGGKIGLPLELKRIGCKKVFIIFDSEETEEKRVRIQRAAETVRKTTLKGFEVSIKWLPLEECKKQDLDAFLKGRPTIRLLEILQENLI